MEDEVMDLLLDAVDHKLDKIKESIPEIPTIPEPFNPEALEKSIQETKDLVERHIPFYADGVHRSGTMVKHNFGDIYKALKDTAKEPTPYSDDWECIQYGLRFEGVFDKDKSYANGSLYIKNFSLFLSSKAGDKLVAGRGQRGEKGIDGSNGAVGAKGADGHTPQITNITTKGMDLVITVDDTEHTAPLDDIVKMATTANAELIEGLVAKGVDQWLEKNLECLVTKAVKALPTQAKPRIDLGKDL